MRKTYTSIQDATLYSEFSSRQTGVDEILEVGKSDNGRNSIHSLIQFDILQILSDLSESRISINSEFDLKLYIARAERVALNQIIIAYPVSESWTEGSGYFYQDRVEETDGATWRYKTTGSLWATTGSSYITTPSSSVSMSSAEEITFNITPIVHAWISGTFSNNGLLIQFPTIDEVNDKNRGRIYFFSKNTHTIFEPKLLVKWDDSQYTTGSLSPSPQANLSVFPNNLRDSYGINETIRINLTARERYPLKTFSSVFTSWTGSSYLPTSSYYSIIDIRSGTTLIPFDEYSKISCDSTGNYFNISTDHYEPLRYYKLLIKVVDLNYQHIFDDNFTFSIRQ